ncbi:MAG: 3-phosphoshikimate 1-carboxyvinyltransferase [Bacteroidales bacterium]|nr:3-phosphoshikimate 1-carboxyvinyltransferase [Bacteroidales bacterium]
MKIVSIVDDFDISVSLTGSKSESNRALMICHYAGLEPTIQNLSAADDTILLMELLKKINNCKEREQSSYKEINCQNAGTVFRFLTTALAVRPGKWLLTGSERMRKRPIKDLVDALRRLGADIGYQDVEGFPPLLINGKDFDGGNISVDISRSSQYASSLLLAAPVFKNGLRLHLEGGLTSLPYIDMTIEIMSEYGAEVHRDDRDVFVEHSDYQNVGYVVESDWSAASYWYEMVALSRNGRVFLENLKMNSVQGDKIVAGIFERFGVVSHEKRNGVLIEKSGRPIDNDFEFDFVNTPDLFPAVVATCAGLGLNATFTGLKNLAIKESNRISAMVSELRKIGAEFEKISDDVLKIKSIRKLFFFSEKNSVVFDSYNDHRIAMSLAPLSLKIGAVEMKKAEAVSKSYPNFWTEFRKVSTEA